LWSAATWGDPKDGVNEVPLLAREVKDETTQPPKGTDSATTAPIPSPLTIIEPQSPYAALYPYNKVFKSTKRGHVVELDDTPGKERIQIWHKGGTYIEIDADGNTTMRIMGNLYKVVEGNCDVHIKGNMNLVVDGNRTTNIHKSLSVHVDGDKLQTIGGNVKEEIMAAGAEVVLTVIRGMQQLIHANKIEVIDMDKNATILMNEIEQIMMEKLITINMNEIRQILMNETHTIGINRTQTIGAAEVRTAATIQDTAPRISHN
jgi:hypothetical protein